MKLNLSKTSKTKFAVFALLIFAALATFKLRDYAVTNDFPHHDPTLKQLEDYPDTSASPGATSGAVSGANLSGAAATATPSTATGTSSIASPAASPSRAFQDVTVDWDRYYLERSSADDCGCPSNLLKPSLFPEENLSPIDPKKCDSFLAPAMTQADIKQSLKVCESYELRNPKNGNRLKYILLSIGPGQDCPSGCFYQTVPLIFDESQNKLLQKYEASYNRVFESLREKRVDHKMSIDEVAKSVAYQWVEKRDAEFSQIRHALPLINDCFLNDGDLRPSFLLKTPKGFVWTAEIKGPITCQISYHDPSAQFKSTHKIRFTGLVPDHGGHSVRMNIDFSYLNLQVEQEEKVLVNGAPPPFHQVPPPPPPGPPGRPPGR